MKITVENKVYHCKSCDYTTVSGCCERHLKGKWHKEGKGPLYAYSCKLCDYKANSKSDYARYINSGPHIERENEAEKKFLMALVVFVLLSIV